MRVSLLALLACCQAIFGGITISENDATRLSFTWEMDGLHIADSAGNNASLWFKNQNVDLGDSGETALPGFSFYVGIPPTGNITVQWTPLETRSITLKHPVRKRIGRKGFKRFGDLRFTGQWLSAARPASFRKLRADQFILKPFIYDEKANKLTVLEKAACTITFPAFPQQAAGGAPKRADFQHMLSGLVLNYAVATTWAVPPAKRLAKQAAITPFPLAPNQTIATFPIGDGHDSTNEATINENGLVKLSGSALIGLFGGSVAWNQVACYASYKGEMPTITPDITALPDGITEVPLLRCDLNNNGIVDSNEYALVYVTGSSDWGWDAVAQRWSFRLDRYEDYRHYWIVLKPSGNALALQHISLASAPAAGALTSFQNHILLKEPLQIAVSGGDPTHAQEGGLDWVWCQLSSGAPYFQFQVSLPGIDSTSPVAMAIHCRDSLGTFQTYNSFAGVPVSVDTASPYKGWNIIPYTGNHTVSSEGTNFSNADPTQSSVEIESIEFKYATKLDMSLAPAMTVFSPETTAIVQYQLSNLPQGPVYIFRINANEQVLLVDTMNGLNKSSYSWTDSAGTGIRYYIAAASALRPSPQLQQVSLSTGGYVANDLRSTDNRADFLIITHPAFMAQADTLAGHKIGAGRFMYPRVVDVNDIYRQFAGGNFDPAAIRNFLVYAQNRWAYGDSLDYVVLMGKGNYNFKQIKTNAPIYIPVAEFPGMNCYEDFFSFLSAGDDAGNGSAIPVPSIFLGRLPCSSPAQAQQLVNKIIDMENPAVADYGAWRNRVVMVSDDDQQGGACDPLGGQHLPTSEALSAEILSERPSTDLYKINLFMYPWNPEWQKPAASDALINDINNGASVVNWVGHGSSHQWADENILNNDLVGNFHNRRQYPLINSFSCDVGRIDRPELCLSEVLTLAKQSGAIAAISCAREAYSDNNQSLAMAIYDSLYVCGDTGRTFGAAFAAGDAQTRDGNAENYNYLGDPSIRPSYPDRRLKINIVNGSGASTDTLKGMQSVTVSGSVLLPDSSGVDAQFGSSSQNDSVWIGIYNPPALATREDGGSCINPGPMSLPGTPVFSGQAAIKNGVFTLAVHLPRMLTFNKAGAQVLGFGWHGSHDALGQENIIFSGMDTSAVTDTSGPLITIKPLYDGNTVNTFASRTDGIHTTLPFSCEIDVSDPSGIDVAGTGPDEGLSIEIPGVLSKQNIGSKFQFAGNDYRKGSAIVPFTAGQIPAGTYTLAVSAQGLSGVVSKKNFALVVETGQALSISRAFNFPNPVKMGRNTAFYYDLSYTSGVTASIKVYTLSGNLVRVFNNAYSGESFDCRDQAGNLLGPNVYLYQITAQDNGSQTTGQGLTVKSPLCKLVVHPPR